MKCFVCGKEISEDSNFCNHCGNKIEAEDEVKNHTITIDTEMELQGFVVNGTTLFKYTGEETTVTIPNYINEIGRKAFANSNVKHVRLGTGVKKIQTKAFENCTNLEDVYFMKGIKTIGEYAFSGCSSLTTLYIFSEDFKVAENTFYRCDNFSDIVLNGKSVDLNKFYQLRNGRSDIYAEKSITNTKQNINDEREQIIRYFNLNKDDDIDVIIAFKHCGRTDQEIRQYIYDTRFLKTNKSSSQYNTPYSHEDYLVDLVKIERGTPDAGLARARVQHYEHGRDPYNLPKKTYNKDFDMLLSIVEWGGLIFLILFIMSIAGC